MGDLTNPRPTSNKMAIREVDSTFTFDTTRDEMVIANIETASYTGTLPLLETMYNGHTYHLLVEGDPRQESLTLTCDAADGDAIDGVAPSIKLYGGAKVKVVAVHTNSYKKWVLFSLHHGNDRHGNHLYGPLWSFNYRQDQSRPMVGLGDMESVGFTGPAAMLHMMGLPDGTVGLRMGDNFQNGGDGDFLLRSKSGTFGTGTMELVLLSANSVEGRLALVGNSNARLHLAALDGAVTAGSEADQHPYEPGREMGLETRNRGERVFGCDKTGKVMTNQAVDANTTVAPTFPTKRFPLYDADGNLLGYVALYPSAW